MRFLSATSGFSTTDILVKIVFLTAFAAVAIPVYFGYKYVQTWEAWTRLTYMAEVCTSKAIKLRELETGTPRATSSIALSPLTSTPHFIFDSAPVCTTDSSTFTATGYAGEVKGGTLSVTVTVSGTTIRKTWGGNLL